MLAVLVLTVAPFGCRSSGPNGTGGGWSWFNHEEPEPPSTMTEFLRQNRVEP